MKAEFPQVFLSCNYRGFTIEKGSVTAKIEKKFTTAKDSLGLG
jgi:hypothetical protein